MVGPGVERKLQPVGIVAPLGLIRIRHLPQVEVLVGVVDVDVGLGAVAIAEVAHEPQVEVVEERFRPLQGDIAQE